MKNNLLNSLRRSALIAGMILFAAHFPGSAAEVSDQTLTTVKLVRGLSAVDAARQLPVKLRGVVTFFDEGLYSRFIQDDTAGIYLMELTNMPALQPGQEVEVDGVTGPGEYAPVVVPTFVTVVGQGHLPDATPVSLEQLISGHEDSQFIQFSGIVRSVIFDKDSQFYLIDFVNGGERFTVYAKQLPVSQPQDLVDSTVRISGVCSTMFNHQRQLFGIRLFVPAAEGVVVEKPAPVSPYDLPVKKINSLLQFAPDGNFGDRVKVTGTVVYDIPGSTLFIENENAGLYCQTQQRDVLQPGDQVEVLGFPAKGDYTPILENAIYRKVGMGPEPKADAVDVNEILTGTHDCRLVQLQARVLDRVQRGVNQFLLLQNDDFTFQACLPPLKGNDGFSSLQNGSDVMVTGICMIERGNNWYAGEKWRATSFRLLLRSPNDVVIMHQPEASPLTGNPWVTGVLGVIALGALLWVFVLKSHNRQMAGGQS